MKIRIIFSAVLMVFLLGACSDSDIKPDIQNPDDDTKAVYLRFNTSKQSTRSVEATGTGTAAPLLSAVIYFLDATGTVYSVRTVGATDADVTVAQIEAGVQFDGIPGVVSTVYVVGNYNSSDQADVAADFPLFNGVTRTTIDAVGLNIQQLAYPALSDGTTYADGLLSIMDGEAPIDAYDAGNNTWNGDVALAAGDLYANVTIAPLNARLEIQQISYAGDLISSFTLEGIYINNYYSDATVDLTLDGADLIDNGSDVTLYDRVNAAYAYDYYTTLQDLVNITPTITGGAATITPGANLVWAYHVFGNSDPVPHIILKLTDVTAADGTTLGTRYVTVTGYTVTAGGATVDEFERNTIYKITDLAFDDSDISIIPEPEAVSVWVHVEVEDWTTVLVTPVI